MQIGTTTTAAATGAMAWPWTAPCASVLAWQQSHRPSDATTTTTTTADAACVARVRAGQPDAFDQLVQTYSTRIYTHLYRLVRNREEAEDLTQESFIRAYRFLHQYDGRKPFRNWLYAIASNVGLNALRSRHRRGRYETPGTFDSHAAESAPSPHNPMHDAERHELRDRLVCAVESLPPQAAMMMHLVYFEGLSVQEAAEIVGMTEANAKVTLHRARKRLREHLVDRDDA